MGEFARLFSRVSHTIFAEYMKGKDILSLKNEYLQKFEITARHFNSCRVSIEGMIRSQAELHKQRILDLSRDIERIEKKYYPSCEEEKK